jgi:esterase
MQLYFREYGSGPPIVILHGLFGSLNNWHSHATFLGERFRVFTIDQRNHGLSPHSPEMTYASMAEDLREFVAAKAITPVNLIGHSMGGKTAMRFALDFPLEVSRLVVVDIRPQGDPPKHNRILEALAEIDFAEIRSREDVERALSRTVPNLAERQFLATNLKRNEDGSFRWKMNLPAIAGNYAELIGPIATGGRFRGPALFLSGGRSTSLMESDSSGILELFPAAQFRTIPNAGHWVHADAPQEFRTALLEFLT